MKTATTLEFRKVVRKVAKKMDLEIYDSYTNGSARNDSRPGRTVGFMMPSASMSLARKIEKKLNKKGLTAATRCTGGATHQPSGCHFGGSHNYIRGTCVLA